jgi:parvulin-like peptidyl-prolyl isomerase
LAESITIRGFVPGVGREPAFTGAVFALNVGEISKPIKGTKGYYLAQLLEEDEFNEDDFKSKKEQSKARMLADLQRNIFSEWYNNLKEKSDIKDFRDVYYY